MKKSIKFTAIAIALGFGIAGSGLAIAGELQTTLTGANLNSQVSGPAPHSAQMRINTFGTNAQIAKAKEVISGLVNADINLDGATRQQLDSKAFVYSQTAKNLRLNTVAKVWASPGAATRYFDIQKGLEFGAANPSLKQLMKSGRFVISSWNGVVANGNQAMAVVYGHEVEQTPTRAVNQPNAYLQVAVEKQKNGTWKLKWIAHRQLVGN